MRSKDKEKRIASKDTERTHDLEQSQTEMLKLLNELKAENEARKKTEAALRENETHFRTLADSGQALIWTAGVDKKCNYFNQPWLTFTGRTIEQELGDGWTEGVHPKDMQRCIDIYVKAFDRREKFSMEYRLRHSSGEYRWIQDVGNPRYNSNGEFIGYIGHCLDITEHKQAEEALYQSEYRLRSTMDNMIEGCQILNNDWQYLYINDSAEKHNRRPKGELLGHKYMDMWPGIEETTVYALIKSCIEDKKTYRFENEFIFPNGDIGWFELSIQPVPEGVFILSIDITERKKTEEALDNQNLIFTTLLENLPIGVFMVEAQSGKPIVANEAAKQFLGRGIFPNATTSNLGEVYKAFKNNTDQPYPIDEMPIIKGMNGIKSHVDDMAVQRPDGSQILLEVYGCPVFDRNGIVNASLVSFHDITERKKAEIALQDAKENLEKRVMERTAELHDLYNNAPCGYHSLSKDGLVELINDTELHWIGYNREDIICKLKFTDIMTDESKKTFAANFPMFIKRGWVNDLEFDLIRKDGTILPILLSATAIYDTEGNYIRSRSTMIDHTERKKAEKALREALSGLEAANKELEAFSYSVSHDLRAPLRALDGYSNMLLEDYSSKLDDEGNRLLHIIITNAKRMGTLIDDLLSFSRLGRQELKILKIDMHAVARDVYHEIASESDKANIEFRLLNIPEAYGDAPMIRQVWVNLIGNAIKFTAHATNRTIEIGGTTQGNENNYYIKDNGAGFDMAYANKLFGVFQRLHTTTDFEGTGVGLAIVKRVIQRMNGQVRAEGKINQGATFTFTLPNHNENKAN